MTAPHQPCTAHRRNDMRTPTSSSSISGLSATSVRGALPNFQNRLRLHQQSRQHSTSAHSCDCGYSLMSHACISQETLSAVQGAGQKHLLAGWDSLTADQRASLTTDIQVGNLRSQNFSRSLRRSLTHLSSYFCRQLIWHMSAVVTVPARL